MSEIAIGKMMMLPAKRGTCAMCATKHEEHMAHNLTSLFYGMRFKMKYGRDPTWSDCCAHLTEQQQAAWRECLVDMGEVYTIADNPIAEPYAVSD